MARAIPLPEALSGQSESRIVEIDSALLFLVSGALVQLIDYTELQQTGTLTEQEAKERLESVLNALLEA